MVKLWFSRYVARFPLQSCVARVADNLLTVCDSASRLQIYMLVRTVGTHKYPYLLGPEKDVCVWYVGCLDAGMICFGRRPPCAKIDQAHCRVQLRCGKKIAFLCVVQNRRCRPISQRAADGRREPFSRDCRVRLYMTAFFFCRNT